MITYCPRKAHWLLPGLFQDRLSVRRAFSAPLPAQPMMPKELFDPLHRPPTNSANALPLHPLALEYAIDFLQAVVRQDIHITFFNSRAHKSKQSFQFFDSLCLNNNAKIVWHPRLRTSYGSRNRNRNRMSGNIMHVPSIQNTNQLTSPASVRHHCTLCVSIKINTLSQNQNRRSTRSWINCNVHKKILLVLIILNRICRNNTFSKDGLVIIVINISIGISSSNCARRI